MTRKWTTELFVEEAKKVHGEKYDYTKVNYTRSRDDVIIICHIHGEFRQRAESHLNGCRCPKCAAIKHGIDSRGNTDKWIQKARKVQGDFYDYSKVEYKTSNSRVIITCPVHGEFIQRAANHLHGRGCRKCNLKEAGLKRRKPKVPEPSRPSKTEVWIEKAKKVHGEHFDYSKVFYDNAHGKVCIICKSHGEFWQKASDHLTRKPTQGCPKCSGNYHPTTREWIKTAKKVHGDKYDYSQVILQCKGKKVKIYCKRHKEYFMQLPYNHTNGSNCPRCWVEDAPQRNPDYELWFTQVYKIFGDKYDYTKSIDTFKGKMFPVTVTCKEHGDFTKNKAQSMCRGCGCPKCFRKSKGENEIEQILLKEKIDFETQKTFDGCVYKQLLKFDFYLPDYNILIEYDGIQHFEPVEWFGGEKRLVENKKRDRIKTSYCVRHNINLNRIRYDEDTETIMKEIINATKSTNR